jgi:chromosome segregation ATPase
MKFAVVSVMTLLALATASGNGEGSPVERVVKLLSTLKAQVESDGKHEQQIYDKYACWCEKTSKRKADDIDEARMNLRALGQHILKLKGEIATLAAEIAELTEKIASNEAEQAELTTVRQKENAAFMEETTELKEALAALQEAIKVLVKGTIPQKGSELIQEAQELRSKQAIKSVLNTLPTKIGLPHARMALLSEFVAAKTGYAPQSATIQGILSDMYLTFSSNVESATLDEANKNHNYEQLYATSRRKTTN